MVKNCVDADCDVCWYRQPDLDPHGCFKQENTTGAYGRFMVMVNGCKKFRVNE